MRQKIIDASIHLFDEKGFSETSIQDIVDGVGVTKGTFYYYFNSKQELLRDIHLSYIEFLLKQQEEIINDPSRDSRTKLRDTILMLIHNIQQRRRSARIFFREMRNLDTKYLQQNMQKRDLFRKNLQTVIEEGIRKGDFQKKLNPDMITRGILGVTNWSYYWFNPEGEISEEDLTEIYLDMILNGISA